MSNYKRKRETDTLDEGLCIRRVLEDKWDSIAKEYINNPENSKRLNKSQKGKRNKIIHNLIKDILYEFCPTIEDDDENEEENPLKEAIQNVNENRNRVEELIGKKVKKQVIDVTSRDLEFNNGENNNSEDTYDFPFDSIESLRASLHTEAQALEKIIDKSQRLREAKELGEGETERIIAKGKKEQPLTPASRSRRKVGKKLR